MKVRLRHEGLPCEGDGLLIFSSKDISEGFFHLKVSWISILALDSYFISLNSYLLFAVVTAF